MAVSANLCVSPGRTTQEFFYDWQSSRRFREDLEGPKVNVVRSALSFLIRKRGEVDDAQLEELFEFYRSKKGITMDKEKFLEFLEKASVRLNQHERVLFVCTDSSCLKKIAVTPSEKGLAVVAEEFGCAVEPTGCHWRCDKAPVVTYKSGSDYETFVDCSTAETWQTVKNFVSTERASL